MRRLLVFVASLFLTALASTPSCFAGSAPPVAFTIEPIRDPDRVQIRFHQHRDGKWDNDWNSTFRGSELAGLDVAELNGTVVRPIRFTIAREAGRIDCVGTAGHATASGTCGLVPDAGFAAYLVKRGMQRPTDEQAYGLISVNAHRGLLDALAAARYPTPSIENFMALTAVGVTPAYLRALGDAGYHLATLDTLIQFAALKITPEFIGGYARAGYAQLRPDQLIQLKAMSITPDFIASFERLGYRNLPVETLVQLKALNVTPEFVRAVRQGGSLPSPQHLVELRAISRDLRNR